MYEPSSPERGSHSPGVVGDRAKGEWKTEDWVGELKVALRANDEILWCDDTSETESSLAHLGIFFVPEDLKRLDVHDGSNFFCRVGLELA